MKSSNKILLSCVAAFVLASGSWAMETYTIDSVTTTGAVLSSGESLRVTDAGSISTIGPGNHAVTFDGANNRIVNDGSLSIDVDSTGTAYTIYAQNDMANSQITNNGLIKGIASAPFSNEIKYAHGIYAQVVGADSNITNNGEIDLTKAYYYTAVGINLDTLEGDISNTGEIDGTEGIRLYHLNGNIINSGDINATSTGNAYTKGINAFTDGSGTILNTSTGIISATSAGNGGGTGIEVNNFSGAIDNQGIINGKRDAVNLKGTFSGSLNNSGTMNSSTIGIRVGALEGNITNSGTLNTTTYHAIQVSDNTTGTILNTSTGIINAAVKGINLDVLDGVVNNQGIINAQIGIEGYSINGNLLNSGEINATNIGINLTDNSSGDITNTSAGEIKATNYAIKSVGVFSGAIYNAGMIIANDGINIIALNDGNITNTGTIIADNQAIYIRSGTGTITNSGTINGNLDVRSTGSMTNSGVINLNGPTTSTIAGNFTQTPEGTLGVDASITGATTETHSKLAVVGTASLADGTNIRVDVTGTDANQTAFLTAGTELADIISAGTLSVDVTKLNITDNSALLSFTAIKDGDTLDLTTAQASTVAEAVSAAGGSLQSGVAAVVLDDLSRGASGEIKTFIAHLNTLPTQEKIANTVAQSVPVATLGTATLGSQFTRTMSSVIQARQASMRGLGSGDIAFRNKNIWLKPFGGYAKQDNVDGVNGFSANLFGLGFGIDGEYKEGSRAGLAFFYTRADLDTNDIAQTSDLDVFNLMVYGSNPIIDDKTNLYYQAGYGIQKTDTQRTITSVGTALANYNAYSFYLQLKATRDMQINDSFMIKPALILSYIHYKSPSYTETGVGGLNLHVDALKSNAYVVGVKSEFNYDMDKNTKLLSNISLSYDLSNEAQSVSSSFQGGGTAFLTKGIKNDAFIYKAGVGVSKKLRKAVYLDLKYELDGRGSDFLNHVVSAKFNYKF